MDTPQDCRRCGACCFSAAERYVAVTGVDWGRLGPGAEDVAHFIGNRAYLRMRNHHCAALAVRRGPDGSTDYFCTIYDRRPQICRDLDRGSPQCAGEHLVKATLLHEARHLHADVQPRLAWPPVAKFGP